MPVANPIAAGGTRGYRLRHIGPQATIWPLPPVSIPVFAVLNQEMMIARPLPSNDVPGTPDYQTGQWTGRINDAGDGQIVFPNGVSSDGTPWRDRFDSGGHNEFLEVYKDGYLEQVFVIVNPQKAQQTVTVAGQDGMFLLKKAFERDWVALQAPRDVIERGTKVWVPLTVDSFPYEGTTTPSAQWTVSAVSAVGPTRCGTGANDAGVGTQAWVNPGNIASGSSFASFAVSGVMPPNTYVTSQGLRATNFGFSVPGGATITGLVVTIVTYNAVGSSAGEWGNGSPTLVIGGALTSYSPASSIDNMFSANTLTTSTFGSSTDIWGTAGALTPSVVNASNFGSEFYALNGVQAPGTNTLEVYSVNITLYYTTTGGASASVRSTGGLNLTVPAVSTDASSITSQPITCNSPIWFSEVTVFQLPNTTSDFTHYVLENGTTGTGSPPVNGAAYALQIVSGVCYLYGTVLGGYYVMAQITPPVATAYDLRLECDGEWIWGFVNGQLVGTFRRASIVPTTLATEVALVSQGAATTVIVTSVRTEGMQPFLMRGTASQGSLGAVAGAGANVATGGTLAWANPNNVATPPTSNFSQFATGASGTYSSNYLFVTDFGFNVPANAVITGVEFHVIKNASTGTGGTTQDEGIVLVSAGSGIGSSKVYAGAWVNSPSVQTTVYGSAADTWGASLTPAIVNASTFGFAFVGTVINPLTGTQAGEIFYPVNGIVYYALPGGDAGDYVLPGNASTFPWGGLHARYFNDLDIAVDANRLLKVHAPNRTTAYAGSGTSEYANQQDANIAGQANPLPGATQSSWSVIWFGSIYLKLSQGNYTFTIAGGAGVLVGYRLWVGKMQFGQQIIDQWNGSVYGEPASTSVVLSAASLAGRLPYGAGTVQRDGWYPIKLEYIVGNQVNTSIALSFTPPSSYTDPGGTALTGGSSVTVPTTSLSPLGMVDNRYQGISHFDLTQQTLNGFAYQASVEPHRLESGLFPGVLAPRIREGHDTDIILEPDTDPRKEPILNYNSQEDATDQAASLQGNGAGFQNGTSGQLQASVFDAPTLESSLFDVQAWQDFSDASFASLLQALLNSRLGLQLTPWQLVAADPVGAERSSYLWPLTGAVADMRWRPGDGLRLRARDISVWDVSPRQILTVQRQFAPAGITGTTVSWANRPRSAVVAQRQLFYGVSRMQRNYQRQLVTLNTDFSPTMAVAVAGSANSSYFGVALLPSDTLVRARVRVGYNDATVGFSLYINGTDRTAALGGPWLGAPVNIDVTPFAITAPADGRFYLYIHNNDTSARNIQYQLFVDVLR